MTERPRGYVLAADAALESPIEGVKASRRSTGGSLTLIASTLYGGPPRHTHLFEDESFYLLDGLLRIECGTDQFEATTGAFAFLPRNVPHVFSTVGGPARLLIIATPGGLEDYFAALRTAADDDARAAVRHTYGIVRA